MSRRHHVAGVSAALLSLTLSSLAWPANVHAREGEPGLPTGAVARVGRPAFWHGSDVAAVAYSPDEKFVASFGEAALCLWDADTGRRLWRAAAPEPAPAAAGTVPLTLNGPPLAFAGDGKFLALAHVAGRSYQVYDAATGKLAYQVEMPVTTANVPPPAGLPAGVVVAARQRGQAGPLALSPDGHRLAFAAGAEVRVWDLPGGKLERTLAGHAATVLGLAFAPDGRTLVSAGEDQTARVWDLREGQTLHVCKGFRAAAEDVAFAPGGGRFAVASQDGTLRLWDAGSGKELARVQWRPLTRGARATTASSRLTALLAAREVGGGVNQLWFDPAGKTFGCAYFTAGGASTTSVNALVFVTIDADTGKELSRDLSALSRAGYPALSSTLSTSRGVTSTRQYAYAPGRRKVAWAADSYHVRVSSVAGDEDVAPGAVLQAGCADVALAGSVLAFVREDDLNVYLYDWRAGRPLKMLSGHTALPQFVDNFTPAGGRLVTAARSPHDQTVSVWDVARGAEALQIAGWNPGTPPTSVLSSRGTPGLQHPALSPDGRRLAWRDGAGKLRVTDLDDGRDVAGFDLTWQGEGSVSFTADGKQLVVADALTTRRFVAGAGTQTEAKTTVTVFDAATGGKVGTVGPGPLVYPVSRVQVAGRYLLAACRDGQLRVLDRAGGDLVATLGNFQPAKEEDPAAAALVRVTGTTGTAPFALVSPDHRLVAVRGADGQSVEVWELATAKRRARLAGHSGRLHCMCFSTDGRHLATGSSDGTVLLWAVGVADRQAAGEPDTQWNDLGGDDAAAAHQALLALLARPDDAVRLCRERLKSTPLPGAEVIDKLIADLDSPQFIGRQRAEKKLAELGDAVRGRLQKALEVSTSLESQQRLTRLLKAAATGTVRGEALRQLRAVELLERLGTAPARDILQGLAAGDDVLALEARTALERLRRAEGNKG